MKPPSARAARSLAHVAVVLVVVALLASTLTACGPRTRTSQGPGSEPSSVTVDPSRWFPAYRTSPGAADFAASEARREQMRAALDKAPFKAAMELTFPAPLPGMDGLDVSLVPPGGNATVPDSHEPDADQAKGTILPIETAQLHTLHTGKDVDFYRVRDDAGPGYVVIVASGGVHVQDARMDASQSGPGPVVLWVPNDVGYPHKGSSYSWLKVTSLDGGALRYRIAHVRLMPSGQTGQETPQIAAEQFYEAVRDPDPRNYWEATGARATTAAIAAMGAKLFGSKIDRLDGGAWYDVTSDENAPLQRVIVKYGDTASPIALWARSEKRGERWFVVAAGLDGSASGADVEAYVSYTDSSVFDMPVAKPAIYLYPPATTTVDVHLAFEGVVTTSAPTIDPAGGGWTVTAGPDGTIRDAAGRIWPYLFWEGKSSTRFDMSTGFVVSGARTKDFLENALGRLGLNRAERAAFIEFWAPRMTSSPCNLIHFEGPAYERIARLAVEPKPDTVIRVFMVYKPLTAPVSVASQVLTAPARRGFTLVEWGGGLAPR